MKVKICGITNSEDAQAAVSFGADAVGFVFYRGSPRYILPESAARIISKLPSFVPAIGVFVNEESAEVEKVASLAGIDIVQLHGEEPPEDCMLPKRVIKAIRVKNLDSLTPLALYKDLVSAFLLDTFSEEGLGGTGLIFNWDIAVEAKQLGRIVLAGGLTPENISAAVKHVNPYAVDVSSGVEMKKGKKDHSKMRLFIERAKSAL